MKKIDTSSWKPFLLQEIFEVMHCSKINYKVCELNDYPTPKANLPALTAGVKNQGLSVFVPRNGATILKDCISVSANGANAGAMFYQPNEFTVLQDSFAIQCKFEKGRTRGVTFFLLGILNKTVSVKHDWKRKAGWNKIKEDVILLPVDKNQLPDWDMIEIFMKNIEDSVTQKINLVDSVINGVSKN